MATRFRLTSSTTAPAVSPALQSYSHSQGSRRQLLTSDASTLTTSAYTPDAADHLVAGDAQHIQFVSEEMSAGLVFTSGNVVKFCLQGLEPSAANNVQIQLFVSVVDAAGTTVRATLRTKVLEGLELATSLTSRFLTSTLTGSYTTVVGDRLVVEYSVSGTPTAAGGVQGHNASLRWGGSGSGGDLLENDTQTGTLLNPWIEFTTNITFAAPQALTGSLFVSTPTFFVGAVTATVALTGTLFSASTDFFAGTVALGAIPYTNLVVVELDDAAPPLVDTGHHLRAHARTAAGAGVIRLRLFQDVTLIANFEFAPTGSFTLHSYELLEAEAALITDYADLQIHLDIKASAAPYTPEVNWVGLLRPSGPSPLDLDGVLFVATTTFFTGAVTAGAVALTGTLFVSTPTFNVGAVDATYAVTGTLFVSTPTFFAGVVAFAGLNLTGILFVNTPTFFGGVVTGPRPVPTGLVLNEIGVLGHSNVGTFIDYYRSISAQDLLTATNHGGYDVETWGDPANGSYAAAWAKLDDDEPVGGYRAFWLMPGFRSTMTNEAQNQGWIDHIATRLVTDFPGLEYIWWSPHNTYFATNPGDGDAADLLTFDPWDTNPFSLTTWKVSDMESEMSWRSVKYAIAQGYADAYGPWINLTDAETDTDDRHPTEAPGDPVPNGQSHGGDLLLAFFESGAQGMAGTLFTSSPTFFAGTVTAGAVALTGTLFVSTPSFPAGALTSTFALTGNLHIFTPIFNTGAVTVGPVALTGTLFVSTPVFPQGILAQAGTTVLTGTLFTTTPTFPVGAVSVGAVALTGTLFVSTPVFPAGTVAASSTLTGILFVATPTFPAGDLTSEAALTGTLFTSSPVFFTGILAPAGGLFGTLFVATPTFFTGIITVATPPFWTVNPVGYTPNPVGYTPNPVSFTRITNGVSSPWGVELSGVRFTSTPLFPVGAVS